MYHVNAQGVDERIINVHYYYILRVIVQSQQRIKCNIDVLFDFEFKKKKKVSSVL